MTLEQIIDDAKLEVHVEFVPFSRTGKTADRVTEMSVNWNVTVTIDGRNVLTTLYSHGIAICPGYTPGKRLTVHASNAVRFECENGQGYECRNIQIKPNPLDVLHCLAMDCDVLEYSTFEEWADSFGYDSDSRSAEQTYRKCLEQSLSFRNGVGQSMLDRLRDAFQDY